MAQPLWKKNHTSSIDLLASSSRASSHNEEKSRQQLSTPPRTDGCSIDIDTFNQVNPEIQSLSAAKEDLVIGSEKIHH